MIFQRTGHSTSGLKKVKSFLLWSVLPKTQRHAMTLLYSPCDDSPTAAIVAVTPGGVSLLISKNILFVSLLPLVAVHSRSDTPPIVTDTVATVRVS